MRFLIIDSGSLRKNRKLMERRSDNKRNNTNSIVLYFEFFRNHTRIMNYEMLFVDDWIHIFVLINARRLSDTHSNSFSHVQSQL